MGIVTAIWASLLGACLAGEPGPSGNSRAASAAGQASSVSIDTAQTPPESGAEPAGQPVPAKVIRYAQRLIDERDGDGNGTLDRQEWGHVWGFVTSDANLDGRVTLEELVEQIALYGRYRRVRLLPPMAEGTSDFASISNPSAQTGSSSAPSVADSPDATSTEGGEGGNSSAESDPLRGRKYVTPAVRLPENLPSWFAGRDTDGDGQLSMAEFAPKPTGATLAEFSRYDRDGDGMITPREYIRAAKSSSQK